VNRYKIAFSLLLCLVVVLVSIGCTQSAAPASSAAPAASPAAAKAAAAPGAVQWNVECTGWGTGALYYKLAQEMSDSVSAMSNGRLILKLHPTGALVADNAAFDACSSGSFEAFFSSPIYWTGKEPVNTFLMSVPFTFTDFWQTQVWYWQKGGIDIARESYGKYNLYFVGIFTPDGGTEEPVYMKEGSPIRTVEDFKGKKIRYPQGIQADIMGKLGVSVVNLTGPEIYSALQTGVIDGAKVFGTTGTWDLGVHEVSKWVELTGIQAATALEFVANKDAWSKLSPDLQAILQVAIRQHEERTYERIHLAEIDVKNKLTARGNTFIQLPPSEIAKIRQVALPVEDTWAAKDALSQKAFNSIKDYMKQLGLMN
jgi:TRAP-type mannitol/chloroaromatic compound transport system substrate-binding protein